MAVDLEKLRAGAWNAFRLRHEQIGCITDRADRLAFNAALTNIEAHLKPLIDELERLRADRGEAAMPRRARPPRRGQMADELEGLKHAVSKEWFDTKDTKTAETWCDSDHANFICNRMLDHLIAHLEAEWNAGTGEESMDRQLELDGAIKALRAFRDGRP